MLAVLAVFEGRSTRKKSRVALAARIANANEGFGCRLLGQVTPTRLFMQLPILGSCNCFSPGLRPLLRCFGAAFWRSLLSQTSSWENHTCSFVSTLPYSFELCRHKPLRLPKSARQGKVELLLCTYTDLDSRQGKVLGISSWSGVPSAPAERLSSLLCSLRILLAWQWNRPSTPVVLDPPNLGYWTDSSNWDLVGRPGKAETTFA